MADQQPAPRIGPARADDQGERRRDRPRSPARLPAPVIAPVRGDDRPGEHPQGRPIDRLQERRRERSGSPEREPAELDADAIVDAARVGRGNFGIGTASRRVVDEAGEQWVGADYEHENWGPGKTVLVSKDKLRRYRGPTTKSASGAVVANFERRSAPDDVWTGNNGHVTIAGEGGRGRGGQMRDRPRASWSPRGPYDRGRGDRYRGGYDDRDRDDRDRDDRYRDDRYRDDRYRDDRYGDDRYGDRDRDRYGGGGYGGGRRYEGGGNRNDRW
ncbi:hypothetical protein [Cellulomonas persica]|uniref:Uncharacterized protein n=1 Tax=Cellulomonas persica TaxID=76861 RepID=A0A510UXA7_9CELL|nr:hypothetical protein [Cellulomonas persica]GEK19317.1 hypothetical protein CPE01_30500 [Cellulomonas persica]